MNNGDKVILDLCGGTGAWSEPYKNRGYEVIVITRPNYDVESVDFGNTWVTFFGQKQNVEDIRIKYETVYGVLCAPPCTMFSRARTTAKTPRDFRAAMRTVQACLNVIWNIQYRSHFTLQFWALENPAGHLQRFLGKPPFKFQPFEFGDPHSKQTFIWGNFKMPKKNPIKLTDEQVRRSRNNTRKLPEIPLDYIRDTNMKPVQIKRSITPESFAKAFFNANK